MRSAAALIGALAPAVLAGTQAKNVIYIVPDGYGQASQTMARDYVSLLETSTTPRNPNIFELAADDMTRGLVRTHASDNLITDSASSGTAFACGYKTYNNAVSVLEDGKTPVASILEAAKLAGMKTGLVVTSTIFHATPAVYAAHAAHRNSYADIAAQEIGYTHPLGPVVDVLLGGGRCLFKPRSAAGSCRSDNVDLFGFAEENGYHVMQDRDAFDGLQKGLGDIRIPFIGLFNDDQMKYEIDRKIDQDEPSLVEMVETAVNALHRATHCKEQGYFLMVEASRIDHAGHANDPAAHLHDTIMYNDVMGFVRDWIDDHPDTVMMSAADHECGGLTLNGFNPLGLKDTRRSGEHIERVWRNRPAGVDPRAFLVSEILPEMGLAGATNAQINTIVSSSNPAREVLALLSARAGVHWSSGGHTASDVTLFGYAAGDKADAFKAELAGNFDNTELPRIVEKILGGAVDLDAATERLRANGTNWVSKRGLEQRSVSDHWH
ncbi:repressible alkaline phosphatase [Sodiomyces alkalinus F11]|uniref:Alkaline phosphatase n=1 Tax=Sodiomyces alkalinus (strain CBS 110278 / VKM F-3762 / F11) TaxID=1314773 RepID=A0A3N2PMP9_SODAK|nr:repressible alkaline phosphatase [Sodiomyces alkalinus F11]ROT35793.1 repressible alkaline phosphatase [Sodiomyces alkalinus F11]